MPPAQTQSKRTKSKREWAEDYVRRGWPMVRLGPDGHPLGGDAAEQPTRKLGEIFRRWSESPDADLGVATGLASGRWALRVQGAAGLEALAKLEQLHGRLPFTPKAATADGGRAYLFAWPPGRQIPTREHLDDYPFAVCGQAGVVAVPPSRDGQGQELKWEVTPNHADPAQAPDWLVDLVAGQADDMSEEPLPVDLSTLAEGIRQAHLRCRDALQQGLAHALEAGRLLLQAKERVRHGEWLAWLDEHCELSERLAQKYMQVAREVPRLEEANTPRVADLSLRKALDLAAQNAKEARRLPGPEQDEQMDDSEKEDPADREMTERQQDSSNQRVTSTPKDGEEAQGVEETDKVDSGGKGAPQPKSTPRRLERSPQEEELLAAAIAFGRAEQAKAQVEDPAQLPPKSWSRLLKKADAASERLHQAARQHYRQVEDDRERRRAGRQARQDHPEPTGAADATAASSDRPDASGTAATPGAEDLDGALQQ
jgi:putative DNA primase/helicase